MTIGDFLQGYWWLIFPIFGMIMGFQSMNQSESRSRALVDLVRSYTVQGKDPPPELLKLAAQNLEEGNTTMTRQSGPQYRVRTFFFFIGVAAGCATAYAFASRTEEWAWVFLPFAVATATMAFGQLVALFVRDKP